MRTHSLVLDNHSRQSSGFGGVGRYNVRLVVLNQYGGGSLEGAPIAELAPRKSVTVPVTTDVDSSKGFLLLWEEANAEAGRLGRSCFLELPSPTEKELTVYASFVSMMTLYGVPYEHVRLSLERPPYILPTISGA